MTITQEQLEEWKKLAHTLGRLGACDPECQGRCVLCPDDAGRDAAEALPQLVSEVERLREALMAIRELTNGPSYGMGGRICAVINESTRAALTQEQ